ncbi:hypothetical protein B9Z19DRAFT_1065824 [Tuber borchii]|uniref:Uncharacterized protein n=1 Tax=Tuber borchii TaxID=42251 RepID=A0A2T6ZPR2_TUBBO|nr:hypothetical protein B9Z19DRAFT_1065824 [Tuber borchii]
MPFFAKLKGKLNGAFRKLSSPFTKKTSTKRLRAPGSGNMIKFRMLCLDCQAAFAQDPLGLCDNLVGIGKWYPHVTGPLSTEEEETKKGADKEGEVGGGSRGKGKGTVKEHPLLESFLQGEFPYDVEP